MPVGGDRSLTEELREFGGGIEIVDGGSGAQGFGAGNEQHHGGDIAGRAGRFLRVELGQDGVVFADAGGGADGDDGRRLAGPGRGIFHGIKSIETAAGLGQRPTLRWLPDDLFGGEHANRTILLYYTGLTRLAKGILHEVVRGVLLNSPRHLSTLEEIGRECGLWPSRRVQKADYDGLAEAVRRSWRCNQRLDAGTNPVAIQRLLAPVGDYLSACKLLGAGGGGGYLLLMAKDAEAAVRIRRQS
jgi:hypothetical protein